jgi:hypothetical protein
MRSHVYGGESYQAKYGRRVDPHATTLLVLMTFLLGENTFAKDYLALVFAFGSMSP